MAKIFGTFALFVLLPLFAAAAPSGSSLERKETPIVAPPASHPPAQCEVEGRFFDATLARDPRPDDASLR